MTLNIRQCCCIYICCVYLTHIMLLWNIILFSKSTQNIHQDRLKCHAIKTSFDKFRRTKSIPHVSGGTGGGGKEPTCWCKKCKRLRLDPWVGKIPWRRKWQPTPVILPGRFHGQRNLVGPSPRGHKESDYNWAHIYTLLYYTKFS